MTEKTTDRAAVFAKAAALIEEHGWFTGDYGNRGVGFDVAGALFFAVTGKGRLSYSPTEPEARLYANCVWDVLARVGPEWVALGLWNDAPGRTEGEVLAVLRSLAVPGE